MVPETFSRKSLSKQLILLMSLFMMVFVIGTVLFILYQNHLNQTYIEERERIVARAELAEEIDQTFTLVLYNMRGYFAYGNAELKRNALSKEATIRSLTKQLEVKAQSSSDNYYLEDLSTFTDYFYEETLPQALQFYESGQPEELSKLAASGPVNETTKFLNTTSYYQLEIDRELDRKVNDLKKNLTKSQMVFGGFLLFLLGVLFFIIRLMLKNIGRPIAELANKAKAITDGEEVDIARSMAGSAEIHILASSLNQMVYSIREKEQNLLAQNQELVAQQDELYAQQHELEDALVKLTESKKRIEDRNELTNQLSLTLSKPSLLQNIVVQMSQMLKANRGIIYLLGDQSISSYGIADEGVTQFLANIHTGLHQRLITNKQPFAVRRELVMAEKGFHLETGFSYDLYLPVIMSDGDVSAILLFSRFSEIYNESEMAEAQAMARQVANSLEKVFIYERSEEERTRNQSILDTTQEAIMLVDRFGKALLVNKSYCELIDCKEGRDRVIGAKFEDWIKFLKEPLEDHLDFERFFESAIHMNSKDQSDNFVYTRKDTGQVIKVYSKPLYRMDKHEGTIFVYRDITKEYEVDRMKSEFVSTVSHELRTPLASILGFTELLLHRKLTEEKQRTYTATVHQEAKRLTQLVNDFLDVQKMEAGKLHYQKRKFHFVALLNRVVRVMQGLSSQHKIELEVKTEGDHWFGDEAKMEQVVTNLISNAIKYSPGGGRVLVTFEQKNNQYGVSVQDEGLGIPKEAIENIFTKFYRVDNSDRREIGGTGLGLAIVKEIVQYHGGTVAVDSELGKGSIFTIHLPIQKEMD